MAEHDDPMWDRWDEVDGLFGEVLDVPEGNQRAYLASRTGTDVALRELVQRLLDRVAGDDGRVSGPADAVVIDAFSGSDRVGESADLAPGTTVGRYVVVQRRGRGGMATVYEAQRSDGSFEQTVAIKVLRRGLDTDDLVQRFLTERQILSSLSHPHIARLLDGGSLPDGRPYLVMDLVDGQTITTYIRENALPLDQRLRLFLDVAEAVYAAHRQLIVHRDIKPSNILVDRNGCVKLLDFGIAKLLQSDSGHTEPGVRLLTPEYASPEQLRGGPITTGTDIYQLGRLLRSLLPESDVTRDLGIIIDKATRDDPDERFLSVDDMAGDVRRYLTGRPILSHPQSRWYRAKKFMSRNPLFVPATAVAVTTVVAFLITLTVQNRRIIRERDLAERSSQRAAATEAFLVDLLRSPDPTANSDGTRASELTVVDALQRGRTRVDRELAAQPEVQASLLQAMGRTFTGLGRFETADTVLRASLAIHSSLYGDTSTAVLNVLMNIGANYRVSRYFREADSVYRIVYDRRMHRGEANDTSMVLVLLSRSATQLDLSHADSSRLLVGRGIELLTAAGDTTSAMYSRALSDLARALRGLEHLDSAETVYRRLLYTVQREPNVDRSLLASTHNNLGFLFRTRNNFVAAEAEYREALRLVSHDLGGGHPTTQLYSNNLASVLERQGKLEETVALARQQIVAAQQQWPDGHWRVGSAHLALGRFFLRHGDDRSAIPPLREGVQSYEGTLGVNHAWTALARAQLGVALFGDGQSNAADRELNAALLAMRAAATTPDAFVAGSARDIATALRAKGAVAQAQRFEQIAEQK